MKKKTVVTKNYLEGIPYRPLEIKWKRDEKGIVTLEIENRGFMNRVAQKLFCKPPVSYIHLDEMGSFLWGIIDGQKSILDLGVLVEEKFGEKSHPLYERLAKYFKVLESYGFIKFKK